MGIDILGIDIMGEDILGIDIVALPLWCNTLLLIVHSQNSLVMDGSALKHFKYPDYKNALEGIFRCHMHAFIFST